MFNSFKKIFLNDLYFPFFTGLILCLILFGPGLLKSQLPIATDILSGDYEPWMSLHLPNSTFPFPVKNTESFDTPRQYYPFRFQAIEQIKAGHLPLWNPSQLSGTPLAAEFITGAYYPLNIIFFILPFVWGWGILAILQIYLAFILMYFFLSSENLSKFAASFGATVFALSGFMAGFFHANDMDQAFLWAPLGLMSINKLFKTKDARWGILIAISIAMIGLASHVQILLYSVILFTAYSLFKFVSDKNWRLLIFSFFGLLIGVLICGIQIIPTIELIEQSSRAANYSGNLDQLLSPLYHLFLFLSPNYFGNPGRLNYFGGPSYYHEYSFYIGLATLFFALISLLQASHKKLILFWLGVFGITLILATDNPVSVLPINLHIPFWASITPTRAYAYTDLAIAVLSAFGLDYTLRQKNRKIIYLFILSTIIFGIFYLILFLNIKISGIFFLKYLFDNNVTNAVAYKGFVQSLAFFVVTVILFLTYLIVNKKFFKYLLLSVICLVTLFDLSRQFYFQNPLVPASSVFPQSKITDYLKSQALPPRVISVSDNVMPADVGGYYGFEHIDGYEANHSQKYSETFANDEKLSGGEPVFAKIISLGNPTSPVIDLLGTDYVFYHLPMSMVTDDPHYKLIMQEGGAYMYQNDNSLPRFRFLEEPANGVSDLNLMKDKKLIYANGDSISVSKYDAGDIVLSTRSNDQKTLQTLVSFYPGWKTIINGKESDSKTSADGFLKTTVAGDSKVEFVYKPFSATLGIYTTILGLLILSGLLLKNNKFLFKSL